MSTFWRQEFGGGAVVYETWHPAALSSVGDSDISWLYCREVTEMTKQTPQELHLPPFVDAVLPTPVDAITFWLLNTGPIDLSDYRDINLRVQGVDALSTAPSLGNVAADQTTHSRYLTLQLSDTWNSCKISRTAMSTFLSQT